MSIELSHWAERKRLEFVERVLVWRGWINRRDLVEFFGISLPQATNDLVNYSTLSQGGCHYNVRARRYEAEEDFAPLLTVPDLWRDLAGLAPHLWDREGVPLLAEPEVPWRAATGPVCRAVVRAVFAGQALRVLYWSAHSGKGEARVISPRAFANDGLRVHVRAFCHRDEAFKDFNLSRIERVREAVECPFADRVDGDWVSFATLRIVPNPALGDGARQALARDYGMKRGRLELQVRRALLLYSTRRLGFIGLEKRQPPLLNEVQELLLEAVD